MTTENKIVISVLKGNVAGVGVCIACAADLVLGSVSTILNPYFKNIGL